MHIDAMTTFLRNFFSRRLWAGFQLIFWLGLSALLGGTAQAAPFFQAAGAAVIGATGATLTVAWPPHAIDDVALLFVEFKGGATLGTAPTGFTLIQSQSAGTKTGVAVYWARATSAAMPAATYVAPTDHAFAVILTYRGVAGSGLPYDVAGGSANSSASTTVTVSGVTTTVPGTLIVQAVSRDNNATTPYFSNETNASLTGIAERFDAGNAASNGRGGGLGIWDGVFATAGILPSSTATVVNSVNAWETIALKPTVTTLATGTDPAATTIAPGATATDVDDFTLQTSGGTETVTSVTVNLSTNAGVGVLAITDSAGTVLGSISAPVTGSNTITVTGMSASTTLTNFKVRVTPLSHAAMPVVPGASYAITANVTAWAGINAHTGTDTSPILTIDNLSPTSATATSGTASNAQVALNWTTSVATDFSQSVMLRWLGATAGTEVPVEGTTSYANGNTIGTATVACVRTDAASTAVSGVDGTGAGGCSATPLTNGQVYTYKIFQRDVNGNYSAGVLVGSFTPSFITTLATGTDPAATTIAPGAAVTDVDGFTFQTNNSSETITTITVNLSTASGVGRLSITNSAGTELGFTTSPVAGANTITLTTNIVATTTLTAYKVRVTPLSHAAMPAVPGASYAITAPVTAWAGPATHTGTDTNTVALTIDNASPASATATSGTAGNAKVTLNWTTSVATDFSSSVVLRWLGVSAGTEVPVEGTTTYANGNAIGTAAVACVRSDAAATAVSGVDGAGTGGCSATALTNGQAYTYKIFQRDVNGNYDAGVLVGAFSPSVSTTLGTGTDPVAVTIAPGAGVTDVDGFTFVTSNATETITTITVNLSTASGVGRLSITNNAGTELGFTTSPVSGLNFITLTTAITATTTLTAYKIRVTPLSHAAMPVPPGGSYAITAIVTAWAGPNAHDGSDTDPNALTIDNLSPTSATAFSTAAGIAQVTVSWTTSAATDFSRSVVLRWLGSTAGTDVPAEGVDYTNGNTIGTATVACVRTADAVSTSVTGVDGGGTGGCSGAALTNGQAYTYRIFQKDANGNYDVGVVPGTATPSAVPPPSVTSFNAFESSTAAGAINGRIFTKLAGTSFVLDVVAIASGAQSGSFSGNAKVELLVNTTPGSGYGADNCPTGNAVIQTIASTAIASGRSAVSFLAVANAYRDVRVRVSYPVAAPTVTSCSTDSFAIRPVAFVITSTDATNTGTGGIPIIKTGANFNLTATAVTGYDGTPSLDAALGQVVGSPTAGTLAGAFGAAVTGVAAGNAFTYSEVGNFGLNTNAVFDASFTNIDQTADCTDDFSTALAGGKYGCKIGSNPVTQTVGVSGFGRFIPDHFAITAGAATPSCGVFTYFGQDGFATAFTVTAQNAANATTVNYTGAYAKLDLTVYANYGFTGATLPAGSALASSATAPTGTWANGVANVTARHQISRPTAPTVETGITISATPTDGEVPAVAAAAVNTTVTNLRYGRLRINNAYGSELLDLPVPMEAQHWTINGYVTNGADSCTVIPMSSISMGNYQKNLNACETQFNPAGSVTMAAGRLNLNLTRPGLNNFGSVDLAINGGAVAAGNTCVAAAPSAATAANLPWFGPNLGGRVSFGMFRSRFIYLRENY